MNLFEVILAVAVLLIWIDLLFFPLKITITHKFDKSEPFMFPTNIQINQDVFHKENRPTPVKGTY